MTTETFPLPATYTYGKVVGRVIYAIADTAEDADDKPQARAAAGTVTFTPPSTGAKVTSADYTAIVMNGSVRATLSSSGRILDGEGRQGIWLIVGVYRVTFSFTATSDGLRGTLPEFLIEVTTDHTDLAPLDLATAAPASVPEGAVVQTVVLPTGSGIVSRNATTGAIEYIDPDDLAGGATVLGDLTDVDTADAANGEALIKVSGGYKFGPVASTVDGLSDASTVGKAVAKAVNAAAARSAIGAAPTDAATTAAAGLVQLAAAGDTTSTNRAMTPALVKALVDAVVGGAPGALDTLLELSAALGNDANFSATVASALAAHVRVDTASQGLTDTQKANARTNIGAAGLEGTQDTAATNGNSGSTASSITGGSTIIFDAAQKAHGATGLKVAVAAGSQAFRRWAFNSPSHNWAASVVVKLPASAPGNLLVVGKFATAADAGRLYLRLTSGGNLELSDTSDAHFLTIATGLTWGARYRVSLVVTGNSTTAGTVVAKVYSGSTTWTTQVGSTATATNFNLGTTEIDRLDLGVTVNSTNAVTLGLDDLQLDDGRTTEIPDYASPLDTPVVTLGTSTNPTTIGGSNGSQVVTWPDVAGAASYEAWIATGGGSPAQGDFTQVATGVTSPYTFTGLTAGTKAYGIKAKAG